MRGAWIEMPWKRPLGKKRSVAPPHGERGLKYLAVQVMLQPHESLPPRGAWIEIGR